MSVESVIRKNEPIFEMVFHLKYNEKGHKEITDETREIFVKLHSEDKTWQTLTSSADEKFEIALVNYHFATMLTDFQT